MDNDEDNWAIKMRQFTNDTGDADAKIKQINERKGESNRPASRTTSPPNTSSRLLISVANEPLTPSSPTPDTPDLIEVRGARYVSIPSLELNFSPSPCMISARVE